jgi:bacterioferritin (cytochrome b1)
MLLLPLIAAWLVLAPMGRAQSAAPPPTPQLPGLPDVRDQTPLGSDKPSGSERTAKQKRDLLKSNFEKMKDNAAELAEEANALHAALDKSSADILSLNIVQRAEKIEKLAKKIKDGAKGY